MSSNVGKIIKSVVVIFFVLEVLAALILGIGYSGGFGYFLLIGIGGSLAAGLIAVFLYGFGELVDNSINSADDLHYLREKAKKEASTTSVVSAPTAPVATSKPSDAVKRENCVNLSGDKIACTKCQTVQPSKTDVCISCGAKFTRL